ncbi:hypothetical protein FA95DRAFT_932346 [Auriscalpium vulgare]|uniref:Uncharacterized protein n=1 Tax=Auriscalpium vulgare TaxID=40419 RepID=A0ACB8SB36_9AGAM|nr:hypothetical protein FA95DRAFT_932346 [Auriscalpium vulgare]
MVACPYRACYPRRVFETDASLFQHARTSKRTHPCCVACERVFRDEEAAAQHRDAKHTFRCDECNERLRSETTLEQHMQIYHPRPTCARCGETFVSENEMKLHTLVEHPILRCEHCGGLEVQRDDLDSHYLTSPNHPTCARCQLGFKTQRLADEHEKTVHAAPHIHCLICDEYFPSMQGFQNHNAQPQVHLSCEFCGGLFKDSVALVEHDRRLHFLDRLRASASDIGSPTSTFRTSFDGRQAQGKQDAGAPAFHQQALAVGAERRSSLTSARHSDTSTSSVISLSTPLISTASTLSLVRVDTDTPGTPSPLTRDFDFAFHPTFLADAGQSEGSRPGSSGKSSLDEPVERRTITPSLLDESVVRDPVRSATSANPPADVFRRVGKFEVLSESTPLFATARSSGGARRRAQEQDIASPIPIRSLHAEMQAIITPADPKLSPFHCRICRTDPCYEVTATACGHVFCNGCIKDEVKRCARCPVCDYAVLLFTLLKLDVAS